MTREHILIEISAAETRLSMLKLKLKDIERVIRIRSDATITSCVLRFLESQDGPVTLTRIMDAVDETQRTYWAMTSALHSLVRYKAITRVRKGVYARVEKPQRKSAAV